MTIAASYARGVQDALVKLAAPQGFMDAIRERGLGRVLGEYGTHSALNAGQAVRDLRYLFNHPDADAAAPKGTLQHALESLKLRVPSLGNNLYYAAIPPHTHHEREDLLGMDDHSLKDWFLSGYAPWKYKDPFEGKTAAESGKFYHGTPVAGLSSLRAGSYVTPHEEDAAVFGAPWGSKDLEDAGGSNGRPPKTLKWKPDRKVPPDHPIYVYETSAPVKPAATNMGSTYDWNHMVKEDAPVTLVKTIPSWQKEFLARAEGSSKTAGPAGADIDVQPKGPEWSHGTARTQYPAQAEGSSAAREDMPDWLWDNFTTYDDIAPGRADGSYGQEVIG